MERLIVELATRQLEAYNRADLEAFCACYHPDVQVLDARGELELSGIDAFRSRYTPLFQRGGFGATVPERLSAGGHCVDLEHYWREEREGSEATSGVVLVRYTLRENLIGIVQFLK